jgi:hypothetical protein
MKTILTTTLSLIILLSSCDLADKIDEALNPSKLGGEQSPMGQVGASVSSSSIAVAGISNIEGSVTGLNNGVSTYTGTAVVTNSAIKNVLSSYPGVTVSGNNITVTGVKFKSTKEGIESVYGLDPGIIIKYSSNVGDEYEITGTSKKRVVTAKSTNDDFMWGGMLIKVLKVEENTQKQGIKKITYWGNHKWGMVAIKFEFDDGSSIQLPIYNSANN